MIKWTVYDPHGFYIKNEKKRKGFVVTKEFPNRSDQIGVFPTQQLADDFMHKYLEDILQSKENHEKLDTVSSK